MAPPRRSGAATPYAVRCRGFRSVCDPPSRLRSTEARARARTDARQAAGDPPREDEGAFDPPSRTRRRDGVLLELPPADEEVERPAGRLDLQDLDREPRDRVLEVDDPADPQRDLRAA